MRGLGGLLTFVGMGRLYALSSATRVDEIENFFGMDRGATLWVDHAAYYWCYRG